MDLKELYGQVKDSILELDLSKIWPGFELLKFALYDNEKCFFNGAYIEKTDAFSANTSIIYEGERIAIWNVLEELEIPVLASKIVHEMFHGFQGQQGWTCWPDEMEALRNYRYDAGNLSLKLRENELLLSLLKGFDGDAFRELLSHRKFRSERYPYEFSYESQAEEIEGTANYVEWQALRQLDPGKALELEAHMRAVMTQPAHLFPIRISCYYAGALMIHALKQAGLYDFTAAERPVIHKILEGVVPSAGDFPWKEALDRRASEAVDAFYEETRRIVRTALEKNEAVLTGPYELVYVNIYNARCFENYLTSTFFLMYREGEENKMLPGNFVIRMKDEKTIEKVYRWE